MDIYIYMCIYICAICFGGFISQQEDLLSFYIMYLNLGLWNPSEKLDMSRCCLDFPGSYRIPQGLYKGIMVVSFHTDLSGRM